VPFNIQHSLEKRAALEHRNFYLTVESNQHSSAFDKAHSTAVPHAEADDREEGEIRQTHTRKNNQRHDKQSRARPQLTHWPGKRPAPGKVYQEVTVATHTHEATYKGSADQTPPDHAVTEDMNLDIVDDPVADLG
jgi:hypothetical protein